MSVRIQHKTGTEIGSASRPANVASGTETLSELGTKIQRLDEALEKLAELTGENTTRSVGRLRRNLSEFEPSVTILGQVKAGKTKLINVMAGWSDLLPSDVNPWTSVVTSLHLKPSSQSCKRSANFRFMTQGDWDRLLNQGGRIGQLADRAGAENELQKIGEQVEQLKANAQSRLGKKFDLLLGEEHTYGYFDKNLLERYICLGDDYGADTDGMGAEEQGRFADVLSSADLHLPCASLPIPICLRDTPGVNDTFLMREQITIQAIRESRICVVVLSAGQALTSVDMGLIRLISNIKSRNVVIFVNRMDELTDPVTQIPEIENSIRKTLREKNGPEDAEILFGSAYWAGQVLSGSLANMEEVSAESLLTWAEATLEPESFATEPNEIVWGLSGIAKLFETISDRIVEDYAEPLMAKIASSAITIASSQQAASAVRIQSVDEGGSLTTHKTLKKLKQISELHLGKLEDELDELIDRYHQRVARVHDNFIERALQSLLAHVENNRQKEVWSYDPAGLRMLLRSTYSAFTQTVQATCSDRFDAALSDTAILYAQAFGQAVEGIQISPPHTQVFPAPISLGQTISLDFDDGWWTSWWSRIRGVNAFSRQFDKLIRRETEDFIEQVKTVQADQIRKQCRENLQEIFEQHTDIMKEIGNSIGGCGDLQEVFLGKEESKQRSEIETVLLKLEKALTEAGGGEK